MIPRAALPLIGGLLTLCACRQQQAVIPVNLSDDAGRDALASEQRIEAGIEANALAEAEANDVEEDRTAEAADNAFIANLDEERNAGVANLVEAGEQEDAERARRAQFDEAMQRELQTFNERTPRN